MYKSIFSWAYTDLKTYDTYVIQHTIPMISYEKPIQQKLRKTHLNLETKIKIELKKLLKENIILPV